MKYCMYCGAEIPEDATTCPKCGKYQNEADEVKGPASNNNKPGGKKKLVIAIVIIAVVAALAGLVIFINAKNNPANKFSIKNPGKPTSKNLQGTWEMKEGKETTRITFKDNNVKIESAGLKDSKTQPEGIYNTKEYTIEMTFKSEKKAEVLISFDAAVNKEELQLITDDKNYKFLSGIYKKVDNKAEEKADNDTEKDDETDDSGTKNTVSKSKDVDNDAIRNAYEAYIRSHPEDSRGKPYDRAKGYYDFNHDGVLDMVLKYGSCEGDTLMYFFTARDGNPDDIIELGKTWGGNTDLCIYEGEPYSFTMHTGTQILTKINVGQDSVSEKELLMVQDDPETGKIYNEGDVFTECGMNKSRAQSVFVIDQ